MGTALTWAATCAPTRRASGLTGGLKTWECAYDLVAYANTTWPTLPLGVRVLEVRVSAGALCLHGAGGADAPRGRGGRSSVRACWADVKARLRLGTAGDLGAATWRVGGLARLCTSPFTHVPPRRRRAWS